MKFITVTLNPVMDIHYQLDEFEFGRENFAKSKIISAAGKGVNISRALKVFGVENLAVIILGEENKDRYLKLLKNENIDYKYVLTAGSTREYISLNITNKPETRVCMTDFSIKEESLLEISGIINDYISDDESIIAISGRLPNGISNEMFVNFCKSISSPKVKLILDTNSLSLDEIKEITPWLIKPNESEAEVLVNHIISNEEDGINAVRILHDAGIENVMLSLGEKGIVYAGNDGICTVKAPKIEPLATVGAGDSTIAGLIYGISQNDNRISGEILQNAIKYAVAFGTAACLKYGTLPPDEENVNKILSVCSLHFPMI